MACRFCCLLDVVVAHLWQPLLPAELCSFDGGYDCVLLGFLALDLGFCFGSWTLVFYFYVLVNGRLEASSA